MKKDARKRQKEKEPKGRSNRRVGRGGGRFLGERERERLLAMVALDSSILCLFSPRLKPKL